MSILHSSFFTFYNAKIQPLDSHLVRSYTIAHEKW